MATVWPSGFAAIWVRQKRRILKDKQASRTNSDEHQRSERTYESKRVSVSPLRVRQTHLLHKNGAEWGSFIQEVMCLCSSVASCGTIGSQYVRPQEMKTAWKRWNKTIKIKYTFINTHRYPCNENKISFFSASSLLGYDEISVAVFPCCRLVRMDVLLHLAFPQPWPASVTEKHPHSLMPDHHVPLKGWNWKGDEWYQASLKYDGGN